MPHQRVVGGVEKTLDVYFMQSEQLLDKLTGLQLLWPPPSGDREEPQDKPEWVNRTAGRGCWAEAPDRLQARSLRTTYDEPVRACCRFSCVPTLRPNVL